MRSYKLAIAIAFGAAALGFTALLPADSYAQTRRPRKKAAVKRKPIPAPVLPVGSAEIISQSGQELETLPLTSPPIDTTPGATSGSSDDEGIKELRARIKKLEASKPNEYDEKQKRLLMNLDILTRAEQRSEAIRKQLFDLTEKEATLRTRLDQIAIDMRPEMIQRASVTFSGSMRPEELRDMREKTLKAEQRNLQSLYDQIQTNRVTLEQSLTRADALVERLRTKLEKDIEDSLKDPEEN